MTDEPLDNESLWKMYSPKPNPWFLSEITYEGWGIASFENPFGTIEGKTKINVDEIGKLTTDMKYEQLNTDVTVYGSGNFRFLKFLHRDFSKENMVSIGTENINPCSSLKVQTEDGVFLSGGKVVYSEGTGWDYNLMFFISEGTFEKTPSQKPKYWVVPLINFISTFHFNPHPLLTQHPLRLSSTPDVPDMSNEKQRQIALFVANRANSLISFYFGEKVGYIQPVLEYKEREEKLKSGEAKHCITALMVSEITDSLNDIWFPHDYTNLLSFALGNKIEAPWIEFRDDAGKLVRRKHIPTLDITYEKEYEVINETIHGGLGHLISIASNSTEFGKAYFRVLISHLVRLQSYGRQIEDHMDLLCRTFDTLCEKHGLGTQNLITYLPEDYQIKVNSILKDAAGKVRRLSQKAGRENRPDLRPVLQQIESKIVNAKNTERAFGLAVIDLLNKYEMPDVKVMENYYSEQPGLKNKSWAQTLSVYRGAAVHVGYFKIQDGTYDFQDILQTENHLQDILVRIALKILGYEGTYQPRVIYQLIDGKTIDWVNKSTPAEKLGYKPII